jgi:hypothetical protein
VERIEPLVRGTIGAYDVGLALAVKSRTAPEAWSPMFQTAEAAHELLLQEHLLHAVLPRIERLERFQLLVLANHLALSDAEAEAIRSFVADGGTLLVTGESGLQDEQGHQRADFALADVMGVHFEGRSQVHRAHVRVSSEALTPGIPAIPLAFDRQPTLVRVGGGEILATFAPGEAEMTDATTILWGHPAPAAQPTLPLAIGHRFGRGRSIYLGLNLATQGFASLWLRQLGRNALHALVPDPSLVVDAPPSVEVVLNRGDDRYILHILNYSVGAADTTPAPSPVRGITVRANRSRLGALSRVALALSGKPLPSREENGHLVFEIPLLETQIAISLA